MFKLSDGTYDVERLNTVKEGLGDAMLKKREEELRLAEEEV
jgi:hypothetical protein